MQISKESLKFAQPFSKNTISNKSSALNGPIMIYSKFGTSECFSGSIIEQNICFLPKTKRSEIEMRIIKKMMGCDLDFNIAKNSKNFPKKENVADFNGIRMSVENIKKKDELIFEKLKKLSDPNISELIKSIHAQEDFSLTCFLDYIDFFFKREFFFIRELIDHLDPDFQKSATIIPDILISRKDILHTFENDEKLILQKYVWHFSSNEKLKSHFTIKTKKMISEVLFFAFQEELNF